MLKITILLILMKSHGIILLLEYLAKNCGQQFKFKVNDNVMSYILLSPALCKI